MSLRTADHAEEVTYHYAQKHVLQTVSVSVRRPATPPAPDAGYWVIYIHGGAWRDPTITSTSFDLTQSILRSSPQYTSTVLPQIEAFASIEYRLSPHPSFSQNPDTTDPTELRNAKHPDHIHDVQAAIALLQSKYGFAERYILVGHSCGATLAFQTVMRRLAGAEKAAIAKPTAVVGVEGIYDLRLLRDNHRQYDAYQEFIEGAFGPDEEFWDAVSPARATGSDGIEGGWTEGRLALLAHSQNDELVDFAQVSAMREGLRPWEEKGNNEGQRRVVVLQDLQGSHDEVWSRGEELARVISVAIEELRRIDSVA